MFSFGTPIDIGALATTAIVIRDVAVPTNYSVDANMITVNVGNLLDPVATLGYNYYRGFKPTLRALSGAILLNYDSVAETIRALIDSDKYFTITWTLNSTHSLVVTNAKFRYGIGVARAGGAVPLPLRFDGAKSCALT